VREVGVHLDHVGDPLGPREHVAERVDVRAPEPLLARAMQHADPRVLARERVGELAGAIGARVVDDEDLHVGLRGEDLAQRHRQVLPLVVGREHHDGALGRTHRAHHTATRPAR